MSFSVLFVDYAEEDLFEIYRYLRQGEYPHRADKIISDIAKACNSLSEMPERGHFTPELERVGNYDFREIHVKVYRIIYTVSEFLVYIHHILDGRRDIQDILKDRLLRPGELKNNI
jgi:toxin ParE1/3/4